ncbi:MAG: hypothetical protein KAS39_05055, partial [Actinomycetia bacterium]|nr:hypothetical protein [Actinomycetes bacterium]
MESNVKFKNLSPFNHLSFLSKKTIILLVSFLFILLSFQLVYAAFGPSGSEWKVNTFTTNWQLEPSVAMDSDGDFVVAWASENQDFSGYGVYGQRYSSDGTTQGAEWKVNTVTSSNQWDPSVAMDSDGDFVVTWEGNQNGGDIYGQRYSSNGTTQGAEWKVNTETTDDQMDPSVAMDSDGDFVVTWASNEQDGLGYGVYGQRYSSDGTTQGAEWKVN